MRITVEDGLREIADSAMALRYLMDAVKPETVPEPQVFSGLADMLEGIALTVRRIQDALDTEALATELQDRAGTR